VLEAQLVDEVSDGSLRPNSSTAAIRGGSTVYFHFLKRVLRGSKFIVAERGYMGLAPAIAREGDLCDIIFGCQTPCILQRTNQEQSYSLLGAKFLLVSSRMKAKEVALIFVLFWVMMTATIGLIGTSKSRIFTWFEFNYTLRSFTLQLAMDRPGEDCFS
jgi:hypothetical protein